MNFKLAVYAECPTCAGLGLVKGAIRSHVSCKGHGCMRQGRWKNERVAQSYIRPATIFVNNATDGLGDEPEKKR